MMTYMENLHSLVVQKIGDLALLEGKLECSVMKMKIHQMHSLRSLKIMPLIPPHLETMHL